jgi:hypothetical protein
MKSEAQPYVLNVYLRWIIRDIAVGSFARQLAERYA